MKNLNEALGVPSNIYETSVEVYDKLVRATKKLEKKDFVPNEGARITMRGDFLISDFPFNRVKFQIGIEESKKIKEPEIISMVIRNESKKTEDFKLETIKSKTLDLLVIIVTPKNFDYSKVSDFFVKNRNEVIENLAHELKHAYDHYKKKYTNTAERASYQGIIGKQFGVPAIDRFLHDIYFVSANENLVRPSEIEAAIRNNQISQTNFLEFLRNHQTYLNLKRISEFSFENLKNELKKEMKYVNKFLSGLDFDVDEMSDRKKINMILRLVWVNVTNWTIMEFKNILTTSFIEEMLGFEGEKQKVFERFVKRNQRFKNYQEFFQSYENYFKYISDQMIRKIAKLYAITPK